MADNKIRCSCTSHVGCECMRAGRRVAAPAVLPGRLAGVKAPVLTATARAQRPVRGTVVPVRRTPAQEAKRQAAIDQFMRSQPTDVRAKFSSRPAPRKAPRRRPVPATKLGVTDQLSAAWSSTFTVGGWRQARALGDVMVEARNRGLGHDPATEPLVAAYTTAMSAGDMRAAELAHGRLVSHVRGLLDEDYQQEMDRLAIQRFGPVRGRQMIRERRTADLLRGLAVREFGAVRVAVLRDWAAVKRQVDRSRRQPGGVA